MYLFIYLFYNNKAPLNVKFFSFKIFVVYLNFSEIMIIQIYYHKRW